MSDWRYRPYVPVAARRAEAKRRADRLEKSGKVLKPVQTEGRGIAKSFWGKAWCKNLESLSDYENRLPRGRTYVRNGTILDLQISGGRIEALVAGSALYEVHLGIKALPDERWQAIRRECSGHIDSLVELLQGKLSKGVLEAVTRSGKGLLPVSSEISLACTCPDWARLCKHAAAVLYGVGVRLDTEPEMLFTLRGVDPAELITDAVRGAGTRRAHARGPVLDDDVLSSVFGIEIDAGEQRSNDTEAAASSQRSARDPEPPEMRRELPLVVLGEVNTGDALEDVVSFVGRFCRASRAGVYFELPPERLRHVRMPPDSTLQWADTFVRLLDRVAELADDAEYAAALGCYTLLFALLVRIDTQKDVVYFADPRGSAQVGVAWEDVLPIWAVCLAETASPAAFAEEVLDLYGSGLLDSHWVHQLFEEADFVASDAQRAELDARLAALG